MALKQFIKESFFYTVTAVLTRAMMFLVIPLYVACLPPADFGLINLFHLYVGLGSVLVLAGFDQAVIRFFPKAEFRDQQQYFSTALMFLLFLSGLVIFILWAFRGVWLRVLFDGQSNRHEIYWLAAVLVGESFFVLMSAALKANRHVHKLLMVNIAKFGTFLAANVVALYFLHLGIEGVLFSFFLSDLAGLLAGAQTMTLFRPAFFSREKFAAMLRYGLPLAPNVLFALILFQADHYLLKQFCGLTVVGYYAFGYKIGGVLIYVLWVVSNAWLPHLFHLEKAEIYGHLSKILIWTLFISMSLYFMLDSTAQLAGPLMLPASYHPSLPVITWIGLAYLIYIFTNIVDSIFNYYQKVCYIPIISALSALLNVMLNLILIPKFEMAGAVWATVISFAFAALLILAMLYRHGWILFDWKKVLWLWLIFALARIGVYLSSCEFFYIDRGVWILHGMLFAGFVGFVLLLLPDLREDIRQGAVWARGKVQGFIRAQDSKE